MTHVPSFFVKQKITLMVNQYRVIERLPDGSEGRLLAFAQQKRMSFKEKVFFYADEAKTQELFSFKARQGLDVRAEHDVFANGRYATDRDGVARSPGESAPSCVRVRSPRS